VTLDFSSHYLVRNFVRLVYLFRGKKGEKHSFFMLEFIFNSSCANRKEKGKVWLIKDWLVNSLIFFSDHGEGSFVNYNAFLICFKFCKKRKRSSFWSIWESSEF